jgi:radical SAM protein with 4Fe4S-binding SPASM domain
MEDMAQRNVFLVLTGECNQRCRFCYNKGTTTRVDKRSMREEDFIYALDWIRDYYDPQATMLRLTGGEPTLHKDLTRFLEEIDRRDFRALLITNGSRFEELYPELREYSHILGVQFSVEGHTRRLHDGITGRRGSFDKATRGIRLALKDFRVNTNTTLSKLNLPSIFNVFEALRELGVERASLNYATPTRDNLDIVPDFFTISEVYRRVAYLADALEMSISTLMHIPMCLSREGKGCAVGRGDITIDPGLDAYPCPAVSFPDTCLGNIRRASPEMLFSAEIYRNITREFRHLPQSCRGCRYVERCKGGCYLFWRHGLMSRYELSEEGARRLWGPRAGLAVETC